MACASGRYFLVLAWLAGSLPCWAKLGQQNIGKQIDYKWVYANPRFVHGQASSEPALDYTHMGMLAILPSGELAAAWQASWETVKAVVVAPCHPGTPPTAATVQGAPLFWEGSKDQGIYLSRSTDAGNMWTGPELVVAPRGGVPIWAPVLHVQNTSTWLFYSESRPECWWWGEGGLHWACGGDLKVIRSEDSGLTWSTPEIVYSFDSEDGIAKMVANKVASGPQAEWLLPFWREMGGHNCTNAPAMHGKAGVLISSDQGKSWSVSEVELASSSPPTWLIEASISGVSLHGSKSPDRFVQLFRTQAGVIYSSVSENGKEWAAAHPTTLPNPNSKIDSLALPYGRIYLAFNDDAVKRSALTVAASGDGGMTWQRLLVLESDPAGSFSYPTLQYLPDEDLLLVIYSVAYPPGYQPPTESILGRFLQVLQRSVRWQTFTARIQPREEMRESRPEMAGALSTNCNAWGSDAYGLRVARIPVSQLGW